MVSGAPAQARWIRPEPRRTLPAPLLERLVRTAFPRASVAGIQPLTDGLRNANFKLCLDSPREPLVLRIYEHDASLCQKEIDLFRLVRGSVPVPEVLHAEPRGFEDLPPFALMRYVEGISFRELKRSGVRAAVAQAAGSAGETLAAIGRAGFAKSGWLAPGPTVAAPLLEGADPMPRFIDLCLGAANLRRRMPAGLRDRTQAFVWLRAPQFAGLEEQARLVHGDFNKRNLLVRQTAGKWSVAAVLDWEFAISGSPLADLGTFLRYERKAGSQVEPHFSTAYAQAGGTLPRDWPELTRWIDLLAVCDSLTHDHLPDTVVAELLELVCATVENREPQLA
jgi:aminoglycoside phosphotransferase (APT) family kinase protein